MKKINKDVNVHFRISSKKLTFIREAMKLSNTTLTDFFSNSAYEKALLEVKIRKEVLN